MIIPSESPARSGFTGIAALRLLLFGLVLALGTTAHAADDEFTVSSGLSAQWYSPERSGEGLVLEVLGEDSALVYWFTYDEAGNQRWLIDVGSIDGDTIVFPELSVTRGGRFGPDFDPEQVETRIVGEAVLSFSDCDTAEWSYTAFGEAETLAMTRLTQTMAAGCQSINGVPGQPVMAYAGQSGSWYDPSHAGEGFTLQWMSRNEAALIWFTYDDQGNQYWITGVGSREGDQIVFPMMRSTSGPSFGPGYDPGAVDSKDWGQLVMDLDCDGGIAAYESELPEFGTGELELSRLSNLSQPACPWQQPKLSDLYDFQITEIDFRPLADDSVFVLRDLNFTATDIALDGTVVGYRTTHQDMELFVWSPQTEEFSLSDPGTYNTDVVVTSDASRAIATQRISPSESESDKTWVPIWKDESSDQWELITSIDVAPSITVGVSKHGRRLVGSAKPEGGQSVPWSWGVDSGQEFFSVDSGMSAGIGRSISDDGKVLVGTQVTSSQGIRQDFATRWTRLEGPEILRDSEGTPLAWSLACNADGTVIPGSLHGGVLDPGNPDAHKFWLWTDSSGAKYLESDLPQAIDWLFPPSRLVFDTTSDGSLFVGRYLALIRGARTERPVIWTQKTGVQALFAVLEGVSGWDDNWGDVQAVSVSEDGRKILLTGEFLVHPERALGRYARAVIVELIPK